MNMNTISRQVVIGTCASIAIAATTSLAGPSGGAFEITWHTIDAGGTTSTSGGSFELAGTIGQPDAGAAII